LFFSRKGIFENVYEKLYQQYIRNKRFTKLKYQSIDSSFIMNKNGKQRLGRNKFFKNKNCYKLSFIVDTYGFPLSIHINSGNINDSKLGLINLNRLFLCTKKIDIYKKPYLLADKMYDTKEFRNKCKIQTINNKVQSINYEDDTTICSINKL